MKAFRPVAHAAKAGLGLFVPLLTALLSGCAAGHGATEHTRGGVVHLEEVSHFDRGAIDESNHNIALTGSAQCDVSVVQLTYYSIGVRHEPAVLSAGLYVPEHCAGPFPILAEAHGTETDRRRLTTEVGPGNSVVAFFAAHGYLVVATDYLGLGKSDYPYHPYLHADSEASAIIDSIRAARAAARTVQAPLSGQVMLLGYSQGGHAALAAQREIERHHPGEFQLAAAAPMAGPYQLSQTFMSAWFGRTAGEDNGLATELFAYAVVSYNRIYGNIYSDPREVFASPYAETVEGLFPGTRNLFEIVAARALPPGGQLDQLRNPAFSAAFLLDAHQPFREALGRNDLLDWTPATPMMLCGSRRDAVVDFNNTYAAQAAFRSGGVEVPIIDVADEIPASASGEENHTRYGAPLCYAAARSKLFDPVKAGRPAETAPSAGSAHATR